MSISRLCARIAGHMRPKPRRVTARRRGLRDDQGITLVEMLVVLGIIALIGAIVGPRVIGYLAKARTEAAVLQVNAIVNALELYAIDNGSYPSQADGLRALITPPAGARNWRGPYLKKADGLIDPWGKPYLYRFPGKHAEVDVFSLGRDNAEGGAGEDRDVHNW